jgi:hypothetical protein
MRWLVGLRIDPRVMQLSCPVVLQLLQFHTRPKVRRISYRFAQLDGTYIGVKCARAKLVCVLVRTGF